MPPAVRVTTAAPSSLFRLTRIHMQKPDIPPRNRRTPDARTNDNCSRRAGLGPLAQHAGRGPLGVPAMAGRHIRRDAPPRGSRRKPLSLVERSPTAGTWTTVADAQCPYGHGSIA